MRGSFYNLGQFFSEVSKLYGHCAALRYKEHQYNYSDLTTWIESLGTLLISNGIKRGDVVAIGNNKRPLSYALMLASIRLGVAYVNIDVTSPLDRNLRILNTSGTKILFFDANECARDMRNLSAAHNCKLVELSLDILPVVSSFDRDVQNSLMHDVDGSCIAYIMFTSGSTGLPKGVAVTHQNLLHFISWGQQYFNISEMDNFANLSPMYFDNSVFDFYVGLFSGASLSPISREILTNPYEVVSYVEEMECSVWFSVPSLLIYLMTMKAITAKALPRLRYIVFGGESYPKAELKKLYDLFQSRANLVNVYGPTECTCICSAYVLNDKDFLELEGLPPLGKLNCNFDYKILDELEQDAKNGELCLIGPNVAAGYFNDPELTARSFFTLGESSRFMKRMYKTGDLVAEKQGNLYFVGRKDNQVKHMGYRIELEEIEYALLKFTQVNQAAVIYQRTNSTHGKIIGFVASSDSLNESALLTQLVELLPSYMIPNRIVILPVLPKNSNGKVDRQQLSIFSLS